MPRMQPLLVVSVALSLCGTALAQKQDEAKRTRSIRLTERAGIARTQVPVEVTVRFERAMLADAKAVRLYRVEGETRTPVPRQILDVRSHAAVDSFAPTPQTFVRLAFPADVPANSTAAYEVALQGAAAPAAGRPLKVTGEGTGKSVDTGAALFELHGPSGQLKSFSPKTVSNDRLIFLQFKDRGELPIHWNPDVWPTGGQWGHTSDWNAGVAFTPERGGDDRPPAGAAERHPFLYREWNGPLLYRTTRWGRMPFAPQVDVSVTYTFYAGMPFVSVESLIEFREDLPVHTVRNAELVFSRHQFDTAFWTARDGALKTAPAYDYDEKDRSFQQIARLPADAPCLGFANQRKGYGAAWITLNMTNLNKRTGDAADEGAHFYIRDYDEHGKGSPANFLYFVRPLVYRDGYLPTTVSAGSLYAARSALVLFKLEADSTSRYAELIQWQKRLASPLEIAVD